MKEVEDKVAKVKVSIMKVKVVNVKEVKEMVVKVKVFKFFGKNLDVDSFTYTDQLNN